MANRFIDPHGEMMSGCEEDDTRARPFDITDIFRTIMILVAMLSSGKKVSRDKAVSFIEMPPFPRQALRQPPGLWPAYFCV
jgi:hypothetical protein